MKKLKHVGSFAGYLTLIFSLSVTVAYLRIQSTLIGYQLGDLKDQENTLLEQRSILKMELAKLTKKENLTILASRDIRSKSQTQEALALR